MPTISTLRRLRRLALVPALALASACGVETAIQPDVLAGNYTATSFIVTQSGQAPVDVIAKGGSMTINIAADSTITGTLVLPAGVPNSQAGTANMAGKALPRSDGTLRFEQTAETFVKSLIWQRFTDALVSTSLLVNTQFQITLRK